jgi:hypothetical protein
MCRIRRFYQYHTLAPGVFSLPELADGFRRLIQPLAICQQRE